MRSFINFSPAFILVILSSVASAADWPQYLGLKGDAVSSETINGDWKTQAPKILWKAKVGKGCGSWSIVGGKALVVGNDKGNDIVSCRAAGTGKLIWQHQYPEKLVANLYEGGPNTTPTVDGPARSISRRLLGGCRTAAGRLPVQGIPKSYRGKSPASANELLETEG